MPRALPQGRPAVPRLTWDKGVLFLVAASPGSGWTAMAHGGGQPAPHPSD